MAEQASVGCGRLSHCEQRGRHEPAKKTQEERVAFVKAHFDSFPKYESHYSRSDNPNRNFLSPSLSVSTMYDLYKAACAEEKETPVSEWTYRHIKAKHLSFTCISTCTCTRSTSMHVYTVYSQQASLNVHGLVYRYLIYTGT